MGPGLIFMAMMTLTAVIAWLAYRYQVKASAALVEMAQRLGLTVVKPPGKWGGHVRIAGLQHGRRIEFWTYSTGSGKSRQNWAAVGVRPNAQVKLTFEVRLQNWGTKLFELFGAKEITVGDPEFDRAWFVQTNQPEFLAAALVPAIRERLMASARAGHSGSYRLADGMVSYCEPGSFYNADQRARMEAKLPVLHELADLAEVSAST